MIGTLEKLNNPNVDMYEMQTDFLSNIRDCKLDKEKLSSLMACMITNQETLGLSNQGLKNKQKIFKTTVDIFYNNKMQEISLSSSMIR